jgi:hypothetical protein
MCPALLHARIFRRQTLNNTRLGTDGGDGLADIVMQLARHLLPDNLFGFQQALRQTTITRQLGLQGLVQLTQTLNTRSEQQPGQALRQQRSSKSTG